MTMFTTVQCRNAHKISHFPATQKRSSPFAEVWQCHFIFNGNLGILQTHGHYHACLCRFLKWYLFLHVSCAEGSPSKGMSCLERKACEHSKKHAHSVIPLWCEQSLIVQSETNIHNLQQCIVSVY